MSPLLRLLAAVLLLSGCANARIAREPVAVTPPPPVSSTPISVLLYTRKLKFDEPTHGLISPRMWKGSAMKQLRQALLSFPSMQLAEEPVTAPSRLLIEATQATAGSKGWSWVSSMTKFIVPSKEETVVHLDARLMQGETIAQTFHAEEAYTTKKHIFLLLAPWKWKTGVPGAVAQAAFRELLRQVQPETAP